MVPVYETKGFAAGRGTTMAVKALRLTVHWWGVFHCQGILFRGVFFYFVEVTIEISWWAESRLDQSDNQSGTGVFF